MSSQNLYILILVFLFFLFSVLLAVVYFMHRYFKLKEKQIEQSKFSENRDSVSRSSVSNTNAGESETSHQVVEKFVQGKVEGAPVDREEHKKAFQLLKSKGKDFKTIHPIQSQTGYCVDHPDQIGIGVCAISNELYCEHCLVQFDTFKISKKFQNLYLAYNWVQVYSVPEKSDGSRDLIQKIWKIKDSIWQENEIPIIIQGQYKINVENDLIESYIVILSRQDDQEFLENKLALFH
ncbi:hypothetical protein N9N67_04015 [Bacteriovoracaceae bacterium]|nr:hypothetical protein [Bacteriovoracaceae bacterium]